MWFSRAGQEAAGAARFGAGQLFPHAVSEEGAGVLLSLLRSGSSLSPNVGQCLLQCHPFMLLVTHQDTLGLWGQKLIPESGGHLLPSGSALLSCGPEAVP